MARKTLAERRSEKLDELERIKSDLARIEERAAAQLGRLAVRAGLADLDIEDEQLAKEFAAVAAKFQSKGGKKDKPAPTNAGAASQG
jgi:hypothetical protein